MLVISRLVIRNGLVSQVYFIYKFYLCKLHNHVILVWLYNLLRLSHFYFVHESVKYVTIVCDYSTQTRAIATMMHEWAWIAGIFKITVQSSFLITSSINNNLNKSNNVYREDVLQDCYLAENHLSKRSMWRQQRKTGWRYYYSFICPIIKNIIFYPVNLIQALFLDFI